MPKPSKCPMCGRMFTPSFIFKAEDLLLCDSCRRYYKNTADLYCLKCNNFVGRVKIGRRPNGFEIKKGDVLHVYGCPECSPGQDSSVILELEEYNAKQRQVSKNQ